MFISFEGGEGSGKTTQITLLADYLKAKDIDLIVTREPGGTPLAETIRPLLVESHPSEEWHPVAEMLLFLAARVQHYKLKIAPALANGKWVLCDRFSDSSLIYQGLAKGLGENYISSLQRMVMGDSEPDCVIVMDIAAETGLKRAEKRNAGEDRFEKMDLTFHQKLRQGFLTLAENSPRHHVINADQPAEVIHQQIAQLFD